MPFNATAYKANKYAKSAWSNLAKARELKAAATAETATDFDVWQSRRIEHFVRLALIDMRLSVGYRRLRHLGL